METACSEDPAVPRPILSILAATGVATLALLLTLLDLLVEQGAGWLPGLAVDFFDRLILIGAAVVATLMVLRLAHLSDRTDRLELNVERAAREGKAWRAQSRRFLDGLSAAIERQFSDWDLTPAEADVAGLLLKGATLREIAVLRRTSEATTRQQAQSVYRKSGLASRAELSAYFLEDLFSISEMDVRPQSPDGIRFDA
ncbi:helix-turn-helix transcriptional regulator [Tropicimonas aquimaris]|uniref:Helix-turn-helix transcriptional regulator n=1 Tax=Tropicimonas aquimaris TaxID=914152 RepID=A0ABW3IVW0_9RHOB